MNNLKAFWFWRRDKTTALAKAFDKYAWFPIVLAVNWVWGFPAAVISEYRRQSKLEKQMHDALIDDTFLDRASRG